MKRFRPVLLAWLPALLLGCFSAPGTPNLESATDASSGASGPAVTEGSGESAGSGATAAVTDESAGMTGMTSLTGMTSVTSSTGVTATETGVTGETVGGTDDTGTPPNEHAPHGNVDHIGCDGVWGWAIDDDQPLTSLAVRIDFGGTQVMATADQPRPDVCGGEPCDHGFSVNVPLEVQNGADLAVTVYAIDPQSNEEVVVGAGPLKCGGADPDPFTVLFEDGDSYVRYRQVPDIFEKTDGFMRDAARKMMPMDLHTWSIANFNRDLLMFSHFRLMDKVGYTLFEYNDTIGAVHVVLAQNDAEKARGNNHQPALSEFLIVEGDYQVEYTLKPGSAGHPSLMLWRQRQNNQFLLLVGANVNGNEQGSIEAVDGILVNFNETVTRSFSVQFLDEDNAIYKSNANGFEN